MVLIDAVTALGRTCKACGADDWRPAWRPSGKEMWRCRPCWRKLNRDYQRTLRMRAPTRHLVAGARRRAKQQGLVCTITEADVTAVWPTDGMCPALGIPLEAGRGHLHDKSPTLDRVDSAAGYVPGNIQVICFRANRIKNSASPEELDHVAAWVRRVTAAPVTDGEP